MTRKQWYFVKQKLMGVFIILVSIAMGIVLDGDMTALLLALPVGGYLIFTKKMYLVNEYYWYIEELKEEMEEARRHS